MIHSSNGVIWYSRYDQRMTFEIKSELSCAPLYGNSQMEQTRWQKYSVSGSSSEGVVCSFHFTFLPFFFLFWTFVRLFYLFLHWYEKPALRQICSWNIKTRGKRAECFPCKHQIAAAALSYQTNRSRTRIFIMDRLMSRDTDYKEMPR